MAKSSASQWRLFCKLMESSFGGRILHRQYLLSMLNTSLGTILEAALKNTHDVLCSVDMQERDNVSKQLV